MTRTFWIIQTVHPLCTLTPPPLVPTLPASLQFHRLVVSELVHVAIAPKNIKMLQYFFFF